MGWGGNVHCGMLTLQTLQSFLLKCACIPGAVYISTPADLPDPPFQFFQGSGSETKSQLVRSDSTHSLQSSGGTMGAERGVHPTKHLKPSTAVHAYLVVHVRREDMAQQSTFLASPGYYCHFRCSSNSGHLMNFSSTQTEVPDSYRCWYSYVTINTTYSSL